jgi:cytochrome P450 family 135
MTDRAAAARPAAGSPPTSVAVAHSPGLPPGLRWPAIVQSLAVMFFTESLVRHDLRRFDGLMTFRALGFGEMVVVWDPGLIKQLFTGDPEVLRAGEANARVVGSASPSSVLALDGERHLRMRRLLSPPFHGEAVRRYRSLVAQVAAAEVDSWPIDEPFAIHPRMQAITLEVILRAVIGVRDSSRRERLRAFLARALGASAIAFMAEGTYPSLANSAIGARLPWLRARRQADRLLYGEIAAHRAAPDDRDDILALLIAARDEQGQGLSDQELHDQLLTLLTAGHETSASTLAWCFERLVRHPDALTRLRQEIGRGETDRYLEAVINETLRVRPVVDAVWRKLASPLRLDGYELPAGTTVAVSIIGAQRSSAYTDPRVFRPERFLDQQPPPYTLIPFGGGARRCVGASFAMMEMKTILRTVLERVELRSPAERSERPNRWRRFTTTPGRGGRVIVTAKQ